MITITELYEKLERVDEITLMEKLEITSEDLVLRFKDRIDEKYETLIEEFNNEEEDDDEQY